jgi:hypothetical protein
MARYLVLVDIPFIVRKPPELRSALAELATKINRLAKSNAPGPGGLHGGEDWTAEDHQQENQGA